MRFLEWLFGPANSKFGAPLTVPRPEDPHIACKTTIRSLEQQRDTAIAVSDRVIQANLNLAAEITRLSQRAIPVIEEGEVEQPASTRDVDREMGIELNDPENLRRPKAQPARVDD